MKNLKLETHDDFNKQYMRSIRLARAERDFKHARHVLNYFRLVRKLQKQCGVE